jgi:hypothetical protein
MSSEFDVDGFITQLERLGLKLTATPLADGSYRVNRWRMPEASKHTDEIEHLWTTHIADNKSRLTLLASRLIRRPPSRIHPVKALAMSVDSAPSDVMGG